jgi:hypothetical protein
MIGYRKMIKFYTYNSLQMTEPKKNEDQNLTEEMRGVNEQAHETPTNGASNRNSHDPSKQQETNTLPVNSLERAIAETDTDSSTGDTHGGRDRQRILREDEDGDGGAHFHG